MKTHAVDKYLWEPKSGSWGDSTGVGPPLRTCPALAVQGWLSGILDLGLDRRPHAQKLARSIVDLREKCLVLCKMGQPSQPSQTGFKCGALHQGMHGNLVLSQGGGTLCVPSGTPPQTTELHGHCQSEDTNHFTGTRSLQKGHDLSGLINPSRAASWRRAFLVSH